MPMDGFTLSFLQRELEATLAGGRVDKVSQPERDSLLLLLRSQGGNHRLLLSANPNQARVQLTAHAYENPPEPPMFCMLMRKHLQGGRLLSVRQLGGDRVLAFVFEGLDELGFAAQKTLYLEIMGRHSNLTLVDAGGTIIDSIKHVNSDMSRVRTVLPGQPYRLPPGQDKLDPGDMTAAQIAERFAPLGLPMHKALMENVAGMAGVCAKEVCAQLGLDSQTPCVQMDWRLAAPALEAFFRSLPGRAEPQVLLDETGLALDFFPFPYLTFLPDRQEPRPSLSQAMDAFYLGRDLRLRMQQRGADLQRRIKNAMDRLEKKRGILLETLNESEQAEQNRVFGELLTAQMHLVEKGAPKVTLPNYYDPDQNTVDIPLSPQLTPAENAQSYYKKYRKAKVAKQYASQQLEKTREELLMLENALEDLEKCSSSADLAEIRQVLTQSGYLKPDPNRRKQKKPPEGKPYLFTSADGTQVLVGKNSLQNDRLTLHAKGSELWLHAQGIPGSHVIIRSENPSQDTLHFAGKLAAYFSKGRNHPALPVDYVQRKHVKKAAGAAPGFVTYTHFQTMLVGLSPEDLVSIAKEAAANG